ncbi:MAG TPA: hypothetical protein VMT88_09480 [Actinomycetes bacterium]|nr:hypothetical protein [Actinomycetes bacterium]
MIGSLVTSKAVAVAFALTAVTGSAAAATGVLPGTGRPDAPAVSTDGHGDDFGANTSEGAGDAASEHGRAVSHLATTTNLTGREKGAAISALASGGKSQAGDERGQEPGNGGPPDWAGQPDHPSGASDEQADDPQGDVEHEHEGSGVSAADSANPND